MKTLQLFTYGTTNKYLDYFRNPKIIKSGMSDGTTYDWIEIDGPDYEAYRKLSEEFGCMQVFFFNSIDRNNFIKEFVKKYNFERYTIAGMRDYYGMDVIYEVLIIGKLACL